MAQFPALPLWTDAYLADTTHLTTLQNGAYMLMLMAAWRSTGCCLLNDDVYLARITRMDRRTWNANKSVLLSFWKVTDDNMLVQGRLKDERKYVADLSSKNAVAGRASALKRLNREPTSVQPKSNQNPTPIPTPIPTPKESIEIPVSHNPVLCVEVGRKITDAMGVTNDPRWLGNWSSVNVWLAKGYDPDLDILPTVIATIDRLKRTNRAMPSSLNYFEKAIAENHRRRKETGEVLNKPQVEILMVKKGTPEFRSWIVHFKKEGRKTVFLEKQETIAVTSQFPPS